jgi:hypothetical protein
MALRAALALAESGYTESGHLNIHNPLLIPRGTRDQYMAHRVGGGGPAKAY